MGGVSKQRRWQARQVWTPTELGASYLMEFMCPIVGCAREWASDENLLILDQHDSHQRYCSLRDCRTRLPVCARNANVDMPLSDAMLELWLVVATCRPDGHQCCITDVRQEAIRRAWMQTQAHMHTRSRALMCWHVATHGYLNAHHTSAGSLLSASHHANLVSSKPERC